MVNKVMEAKRLKMKRAKRTFPKRYTSDYIPVGMPPNREVMGEYKERTKSLAFDDKYLAFLELHARFKNKPPGKVEAEASWARIRDACPSLMNVVLVNTGICKVQMFYNSERTAFIIYEENYVGRFIRASIRYQNRERCLARYKSGQVQWVEFISSSPL